MPGKRKSKRKTASTDQGRENQLVSFAIDLAEKQLQEGTASSQVITHFLKLGSTRERLEQERLAGENELLKAKVDTLQSAQRVEELYADALKAMRSYSGQEIPQERDEDYDED